MKKLVLLGLVSVIAIYTFGQIQTFTPAKEKVDSTLLFPASVPYDSLSNINKDNIQNLIGQELQFLPTYSGENFSDYAQVGVYYHLGGGDKDRYAPSSFAGSTKYSALINKLWKIIGFKKKRTPYLDKEIDYWLKVVEPNTSDTLYMNLGSYISSFDYIILGYYDKLCKTKIGQKIIMRPWSNDTWERTKPKVYNRETHELISGIKEGDIFDIEGISFIPGERTSDYTKMVYLISNPSYPLCYVAANASFIEDLESYNVRKAEEAARLARLIKKYGKRKGTMIANRCVELGFTKEMVLEAAGQPQDINYSTGSWGRHEQWIYGGNQYYYFENGILTAIQD